MKSESMRPPPEAIDYNDKSGLAAYWLEENIGRVLLVLLFAVFGLWGVMLQEEAELDWARTIVKGIGAELAGIVIAATTIDYVNNQRQEKERRLILISQLGSMHRTVTELAIIELTNRGWLYDGALAGVVLTGEADLSGAMLKRANLSGADLGSANLSGADLREVNLSGAMLKRADLSGADLGSANLSGADLEEADLSEASLEGAGLRGARLWAANLSRALLLNAEINGANLGSADLRDANLMYADMESAIVRLADLSGAYLQYTKLAESDLEFSLLRSCDLELADLTNASLTRADMTGAVGWAIDQLRLSSGLEGTIMPDGTQLIWEDMGIGGPNFEEWASSHHP